MTDCHLIATSSHSSLLRPNIVRLFRSEKEKQPSEVRPDNESTCPIWSGVVVGLLGIGSDSMERLDGNRKVVVCGSAFGCVGSSLWLLFCRGLVLFDACLHFLLYNDKSLYLHVQMSSVPFRLVSRHSAVAYRLFNLCICRLSSCCIEAYASGMQPSILWIQFIYMS